MVDFVTSIFIFAFSIVIFLISIFICVLLIKWIKYLAQSIKRAWNRELKPLNRVANPQQTQSVQSKPSATSPKKYIVESEV
ncbi:MAG: hypothetical protein ACRCSG_08640 [Cellulosilyticaceae bacterium]